MIGILTGWYDLNAPAFQYLGVGLDSLAVIALVAVVGMALQASHGEERSRLAWSAIPLLALFATEAVGEVFGAVFGLSVDYQIVVDNAAQFSAPLGLTYALLSKQLLDIGFALNRATVFAATSLLVAGVFAALQWGASTLLAAATPVHGFLSQVVIVMIVYYVVRLSRRNTDAFVTRVFFAARDRRLRALRDALDAIDEVSDPDAIAPFAMHFLATRASIEACIYFEQTDGNYAPASGCEPGARILTRDEAGVIALRARRQPLHVPELQSLGGIAFPMMVHQRLSGIMLCRASNEGELAPDEIHALARISERIVGDRYYLQGEVLRRELDTLRRSDVA